MINILLPTDFSKNAQAAADFTLSLFEPKRVKLTLLNAVVPPRSTSGMMVNITDMMVQDAEKELMAEEERLKEAFGADVTIEYKAQLGYLQDILPAVISAHRSDLIVMGTKGENDLASKVLGSNTEHIVRRGFKPLIAVPSGYELSQHKPICIATNEHTVPDSLVLENIFKYVKDRTSTSVSALTVLTTQDQKASKSLDFNGMQIRVYVESAETPEDGISAFLDKNTVDLLVVWHKNNTRLDYLFSRSTTKKLTGRIQVPMMIMPG